MHPSDETIAFYQLAIRYLTGGASAADRERLVQQLAVPEMSALFDEMRRGWECSPENERDCNVDAIARRIAIALEVDPGERGEEVPPGEEDAACATLAPIMRRERWLSWRFFGALAASVLILATAGAVWLRPGRARTAAASIPQRVTWVEQTCAVGERLLVTLSDGSKITLNSGSTISHPDTFGPRARVVRLTGEAFFDVTHDAAHPFVIETPSIRVTVLGTQFNVRAYADGTKAKVSVVNGKVQVSELEPQPNKASQPVLLTPGEQYDFSPVTRTAEVQSVPAEEATGWMQDAFIWKHESARSAMRQLERRYGIEVEFSDPKLAAEELNGRFEGESLEEIFDTLRSTEIFDCRLVRKNGKVERVILSPGRLSSEAATP